MLAVLKWLGPQAPMSEWTHHYLHYPPQQTSNGQPSLCPPSLSHHSCYHHYDHLSSGLHNLSPGLLWEAIMLKMGQQFEQTLHQGRQWPISTGKDAQCHWSSGKWKLKPPARYHFILKLKWKIPRAPKVGQDVEQVGRWDTTGEHIRPNKHFVELWVVSCEVEHKLAL